VRVLVSGLVQGVFYRATCATRADQAGLAGFVRNLPDGRVEAGFEGASDAVEEMIRWCERGPGHARVDRIEVISEPPTGELGFRVEG
jgi:acylphosphatase